jgi:hypothetical protein
MYVKKYTILYMVVNANMNYRGNWWFHYMKLIWNVLFFSLHVLFLKHFFDLFIQYQSEVRCVKFTLIEKLSFLFLFQNRSLKIFLLLLFTFFSDLGDAMTLKLSFWDSEDRNIHLTYTRGGKNFKFLKL